MVRSPFLMLKSIFLSVNSLSLTGVSSAFFRQITRETNGEILVESPMSCASGNRPAPTRRPPRNRRSSRNTWAGAPVAVPDRWRTWQLLFFVQTLRLGTCFVFLGGNLKFDTLPFFLEIHVVFFGKSEMARFGMLERIWTKPTCAKLVATFCGQRSAAGATGHRHMCWEAHGRT